MTDFTHTVYRVYAGSLRPHGTFAGTLVVEHSPGPYDFAEVHRWLRAAVGQPVFLEDDTRLSEPRVEPTIPVTDLNDREAREPAPATDWDDEANECPGHPDDGEFNGPAGQTFYCDGSCVVV